MIANAAVAAASGLWLALVPGLAADAYGVSLEGSDASLAMLRLLGVALVAFAVLCWVLRVAVEGLQRSVAGSLFAFFVPASLLVWAQQHAIWDYSAAGWLTTAVFVVDGLVFGAFFSLGLRAGDPRSRPAPPNVGDRVNAAKS